MGPDRIEFIGPFLLFPEVTDKDVIHDGIRVAAGLALRRQKLKERGAL